MNKLATVAAFALLALPFAAQAEAPAAAPAAAPAPAAVAPAPVKADAKMDAKMDAKVEAKEATLKDGTKIVIEGDMVSVVGADGAKTPAPDAVHELADGTKVETKTARL